MKRTSKISLGVGAALFVIAFAVPPLAMRFKASGDGLALTSADVPKSVVRGHDVPRACTRRPSTVMMSQEELFLCAMHLAARDCSLCPEDATQVTTPKTSCDHALQCDFLRMMLTECPNGYVRGEVAKLLRLYDGRWMTTHQDDRPRTDPVCAGLAPGPQV